MRQLLVLTVLAAPLLAGCVSQSVQPASLPGDLLGAAKPLCQATGNGTACNYLMTVGDQRQGNEVTIAVNPKDPNNVVGGAKDYEPASAGQCTWDGIYATQDGGKTFAAYNVPGSPWYLMQDPTGPKNVLTQYWCLTDPSYAFGPDGTFYAGVMAYQGDPITGSKTGRGVIPGTPVSQGGGLNDWAFNRVTQAVAISHDGGKTIDTISPVDSGSYPVNFHDREWVEVGRNNVVYDAWTTGALEGNLFYRSTDQGKSWEGPVFLDGSPVAGVGDPTGTGALPNPPTPGGLYIAPGPKDDVAVSGCSSEGPLVAVSTDAGKTFTPWILAAKAQDKGMNATFRSGMVCMAAMDASDGPRSGSLYVVWSDTRNGDRDIYLTSSRDLGKTWSDAVRVNQDATKADQFFPAISVSPKGVVDVAFYDRQYSNNTLEDVSYVGSHDGGKTWSPEIRVTERSSDPQYSHHQNGNVFIGDYMDIDSSDACAWPVWVDTSLHQKADVMTTCVQRGGDVVGG